MKTQKTSLQLSLHVEAGAAAVLDEVSEQLAYYAARHQGQPVPDELHVSHTAADACSRVLYVGDDLSLWIALKRYALGIGSTLHVLPRLVIVHVYEAEISIPKPATPDREKLAFAQAWGYEDGKYNREASFPEEPAEYGLGGSLVPVKWPEPRGLHQASWRRTAGRRQRVQVTLWSDGTREITDLDPKS